MQTILSIHADLEAQLPFFQKIPTNKIIIKTGIQKYASYQIRHIDIAMYDAYLELVMMFSLNTIYNIEFQKSRFQASNCGCLCRI